jgi:hypothetical protein
MRRAGSPAFPDVFLGYHFFVVFFVAVVFLADFFAPHFEPHAILPHPLPRKMVTIYRATGAAPAPAHFGNSITLACPASAASAGSYGMIKGKFCVLDVLADLAHQRFGIGEFFFTPKMFNK